MLLVDAAGGVIDYLSAGHVPFVLVAPGEDPRPVDSTAPPLGLLPGVKREAQRLRLVPGATLVLVTDGVTERRLDTIDYGIERLISATTAARASTARDALDALLADNDRFAGGAPAEDDLTIVVIRRQPES